MATLLSAIVCLEAKATDDALELFDLIVTSELLARAEWASKTEKLRRDPRLSRDAGKLAAANRVYCSPACRQEAYRRRSVGIGPAAVRRAEAARVASACSVRPPPSPLCSPRSTTSTGCATPSSGAALSPVCPSTCAAWPGGSPSSPPRP
jgi:hypothetical protein